MRIPSASDLVKDVVALQLQSRLADLNTLFGHGGARNAFFRSIGDLKWRKQVGVLMQLRQFSPKNVKMYAVEWLKQQRDRYVKEAVVTASLVPVFGLVTTMCMSASLSHPRTETDNPVITIVGAVSGLICICCLIATPIVCWHVLRYLTPIYYLKAENS